MCKLFRYYAQFLLNVARLPKHSPQKLIWYENYRRLSTTLNLCLRKESLLLEYMAHLCRQLLITRIVYLPFRQWTFCLLIYGISTLRSNTARKLVYHNSSICICLVLSVSHLSISFVCSLGNVYFIVFLNIFISLGDVCFYLYSFT